MAQSTSAYYEAFAISVALLLFFTDGITFNIVGPIFPTEASTKDVSQSVVGVISAAAAVAELTASLFLIGVATPENQKFFVISGGLVAAISSLCFGILVYGPDGAIFAVMCGLCRIVCGTGCGFIWSTAVPVLITGFPRWEKILPNFVEVSFAVGSLLGPVCGSFFYNFGGYVTPFVVAAVIQVIITIMSFFFIPGHKHCPDGSIKVTEPDTELLNEENTTSDAKSSDDEENSRSSEVIFISNHYSANDSLAENNHSGTFATNEQTTNSKKFMTSCGVLCLSLTIFACGTTMGFTGVAIAPFLQETYGVNQDTAGYYFITYSTLNVITFFPVSAFLGKGFGGLLFILSGITGILGYGGLSSLYFISNNSKLYFLIPFSVLGVSAPLMFLPCYPLLEKAANISGLNDTSKIKLYVSIWLNICLNSGIVIGQAVIGGLIYEMGNFYLATSIECFINVAAVFLSCLFLIRQKLIFPR